jgi:copper chaperone CopZ
MEQVTLSVPEIRCEACERSIRQALSAEPSLKSVAVDIPGRTVTIAFDPAATTEAALRARIQRAGFDVVEA